MRRDRQQYRSMRPERERAEDSVERVARVVFERMAREEDARIPERAAAELRRRKRAESSRKAGVTE